MSVCSRNYNQCIHRGISRLRAEEILLNSKLDGSFLVRESETVKGAYTLCVLYEKNVHQYRILADSLGFLSVESEEGVRRKKYPELSGLIHDYVQRGPRNGLATSLSNAIYIEVPDIFSDDDFDSDNDEDLDTRGSDVISMSDIGRSAAQGQPSGDLESFVYHYFSERFKLLDLSSCEGSFLEHLKKYVMSGSSRDVRLYESSQQIPTATHLHAVLEEVAQELMREMESFLKKIDLWRKLFGPITTTPLVADWNEQKAKTMLDLFNQMNLCRTAVVRLEKKASMKYNELIRMWKEGGVVIRNVACPGSSIYSKPDIPCATFEVKAASMSVASRVTLTVDMMNGRLTAVKSTKESISEKNVFSHEKIEQLVKSTSCATKLDIKIADTKKKTFIFEDARQRENFCQLVQQLKNCHSPDPEVNYISLYIGTWNMGGEIPLYCLQSWLRSDGLGKRRNKTLGMIAHDLYVIATQESSLSDKEWSNRILSILMESFGEDFYVVTAASLWSIRTLIVAKAKHKNRILNVEHSSVKTGIANALGNKGAIGVSLFFCGTGFCFINSHLTSGGEKMKRRNQNFQDIIKCLDLGRKCSTDVTNKFHHVFFIGDLNYRIDSLDSLKILEMIKGCNGDFQSLLNYDQLKRCQQEKRVFTGFKEEDISFPPTYRFQKGSRDRYVWKKNKTTGVRINVPSWCDRVLWRSYPSTWICNTSYGCCENISSSDHKPVFGSFDVKIYSQFSSSGDSSNSELVVVFHEVIAELKTSKQETFQLEFSSECIEGWNYSNPNANFAKKEGYVCPRWDSEVLPELHTIIDDLDHLEEQHILICIQNHETSESYGECILALKSCFAKTPQSFLATLTHFGEETGVLKCLLNIKTKNVDDQRNFAQKKTSIDLIYIDTECLLTPVPTVDSIYEQVWQASATSSPKIESKTFVYDDSRQYSVVSKSLKQSHQWPVDGVSNLSCPPCREHKDDRGDIASGFDMPEVHAKGTDDFEAVDDCSAVAEWLGALGLRQYASVFISNGWDNIKFLQHLDLKELLKMGITSPRHRKLILDAVASNQN